MANLMNRREREENRNSGVATPNSSASNYYNADGEDGDRVQYDGNGGIMNFIFRGGKSPPKERTPGQGGTSVCFIVSGTCGR